tara:strand:- start:230 stop:832 length:603 start_codon:yes stop_codon:yes gene_type:complete
MQKQKILKLLIGSNNLGKIKEIKGLLPNHIQIFTPSDYKLRSPKENGKTFKQNSLIKAKLFSKKTKMICLADDSGLEVDLLNGEPGIYSSRWAGKKNNFNLAINKVYKKLNKKDKNWFIKNKSASFVCVLTIYWPNNFFVSVVGKVHGTISKYKKGNKGFGYDPIFIPKNSKLTFGQMKTSLKYKIDHRMKAFKKIKKFF